MARRRVLPGMGTPKDGAVLTFDEIGEQLGISRGGAWTAYRSGMRKLKKAGRLRTLEMLLMLAQSKERREI